MNPCRNQSCDAYLAPDARFCSKCGRDQTVLFPENPRPDVINTSYAREQNVTPVQPRSTVKDGVGYAAGGCLFSVLAPLIVGIAIILLLVIIGAAIMVVA